MKSARSAPLSRSIYALAATVLAASLGGGPVSAAPAPDVSRALRARELLYTDYQPVNRDYSDLKKREALDLWVRAVNAHDPGYLKNIYSQLKDVIRNQRLLNLVAHYFYTGQAARGRKAIELYYASLANFASEAAGNPLLANDPYQAQARTLAAGSDAAIAGLAQCLASRNDAVAAKGCVTGGALSELLSFAVATAEDKRYNGPSIVMGAEGFIGGNHVDLLTQNQYSADFVNYLAPLTSRILTAKSNASGKNYVDMSIEDFKAAMPTKEAALTALFTKEEGFPTSFDPASPDFHKIFVPTIPENGERNIFGEIYAGVSGAQESILYNVYFFGASAGTFMARRLIDRVRHNPGLHVYVMTDRWNTMGYGKEMTVGYNFLRAYAEKFPEDRIVIMPPNIFLKRTALPDFVDLLVSDDLVRDTIESDAFKGRISDYPKAKSDHSKLVVIDGKNPKTGLAFVGSKNITDTSGGISFDEVAKISGPAVPVILDSYYHDLSLALSLEYLGGKQKIPGYGPTNQKFVENLYLKAAGGKPGADFKTMIQAILAPIDVLGRQTAGYLSHVNVPVEAKGDTVIQIGQNNAYGTIRSAALEDINLILSARRQIIISDQFLYDPGVVEALVHAIFRNPELKVYLLLAALDDPFNPQKTLVHIPNMAFLPDLIGTGRIQARWNKEPAAEHAALLAANAKYNVSLSPEYHLKGVSIDGITEDQQSACGNFSNEKRVVQADGARAAAAISGVPALVTGSANKDVMTMLGGFREYQAVIYGDKLASAKHDCLFWSRWNDADHRVEVDPKSINLPAALKAKGMTEEQFVLLLKKILVGAYNFRIF